jgi:LPXTG-site transpeptidase (sortase) family protein
MTALADEQQVSVADVEGAAPVGSSSRKREPSHVWRRVFVISAFALAVIVVIGAVFALFEGPVEHSWYKLRQRALTSDFSAAHAHTGLGRAIAIMQIPRLGESIVIAEGASDEQLRSGPVHSPSTPAPNARGNAVIFGHRRAWGGPFSSLPALKNGDLIAVQSYAADGSLQTGVYKVQSVRSAGSSDAWPFAPSKDHRLTLITSSGDRWSGERTVVTAISGPAVVGSQDTPSANVNVSRSSPWTNGAVAPVGIGILGALACWLVLRRRYGRVPIAICMAPFVAMAVLGILLEADVVLPVLR